MADNAKHCAAVLSVVKSSSASASPGICVLRDQACSSELAQASALAIPDGCHHEQVDVAGVLCLVKALPHSIYYILWVSCIDEQPILAFVAGSRSKR